MRGGAPVMFVAVTLVTADGSGGGGGVSDESINNEMIQWVAEQE